MKKEEILKELRKQFEKTKKKLKFKATFKEINSISYIEDVVLSIGYVSNQFSRQLINRMVETFNSWVETLYLWVMPPPLNLIIANESKQITQE